MRKGFKWTMLLSLVFVFVFSLRAHAGCEHDVMAQVAPYLLPENHPIKEKLDRLFSAPGILTNPDTLSDAGFQFGKIRHLDHIVFVKHPKISGYRFKIFLDWQPIDKEWEHFIKRIIGANAVQEAINRHGYQDIFIVPKKWIYAIPENRSKRRFILVVENMKVYRNETNAYWWKSVAVTKEKLKALYTILSEVGLIECIYVENVPFTKDRKIAFVDTEHYFRGPVPFEQFTQYLSPEMQEYWIRLIITGGNP
jgi:hypothetical protein